MPVAPLHNGDVLRPWLSLLVPAYEYPEGVIRILDRLPMDRGIQCCIRDDSATDGVERAVLEHAAFRSGMVRYDRNRPALGAATNWNRLLAQAEGRHILFMHHDEYPATFQFFQDLKEELQTVNADTLVVLNCWLPGVKSRWRSHLPTWFQKLMLELWPDHLLRHNTWGSPSTVVAPRLIAPDFDISLRWLVDVDWYQRMLDQSETEVHFSRLAVLSVPREGHSITSNLRPQLVQLVHQEANHIAIRRGMSWALRLQGASCGTTRLIASAEQFIWRVVRLTLRCMAPYIPHSRVSSKPEP